MEEDIPAESSEMPVAAGVAEIGPEKVEGKQEKNEGEIQEIAGREQENIESEQVKIKGKHEEVVEGDQEKIEEEHERFKGEHEKLEEEQEKVEEHDKIETEHQEKLVEEHDKIVAELHEKLAGEQEKVDNLEQIPDEETGEAKVEEPAESKQVKADDGQVESQLKATEGELLGEEEQIFEEPPPDPAAPYNLSDFNEALKLPFELRPDQLMEVEQLWEMFQDYTPAYSNLDQFITPKELVYMLKALLLMTYTPEQMLEMIDYCVRPPHPKGHINYEQFLKIVTMRQRDFVMEEQIRQALGVFDPTHSGVVSREEVKTVMITLGIKMPSKTVDHFIKEVDITGDGELSIEDIISTMCIDLNQDDLQMLRDQVYPPIIMEEPNVDKWESQTAINDVTNDENAND